MEKERITRYVRPEDIPLLDAAIIEPVVTSVAKEMHESHPDQTVDQWIEALHRALIRGDLLLVIDDDQKELGLVGTDEPPFSGLVHGTGGFQSVEAADPLNIRRWEQNEDA